MTDTASETTTPAEPRSAADLRARIDSAWAELTTAVDALSPSQLTEIKDEQGWAVRDHLVHIRGWEQSLLALVEGRDRSAAIGLTADQTAADDTDAINALIKERGDGKGLAQVRAEFRQSHADLMAAIDKLSDADLQRGYSHYQPNDPPENSDPVIGWIVGNTYEHYAEHLDWIRSLVGA